MFNIGPPEIILILLIALLVFGPKRLPEIGKTIGKGLREFRRATQDVKDELSTRKRSPSRAPVPRRSSTARRRVRTAKPGPREAPRCRARRFRALELRCSRPTLHDQS
jgi:sec-independent protein translocase protein TatA